MYSRVNLLDFNEAFDILMAGMKRSLRGWTSREQLTSSARIPTRNPRTAAVLPVDAEPLQSFSRGNPTNADVNHNKIPQTKK